MGVALDAPIVDLADADAVGHIEAACQRTGFFILTGHGLDDPLGALFDVARRFFALPLAEKHRSAMVDNNGYAGVDSARAGAGKEMLDIGVDGGFSRWPDLAGFREAVQGYQVAALGVAGEVLRALARSLDIAPDFFAERMRQPQCFLRLLRYPAGGAAEGAVVSGQHTDYGAITLLATDGVPGLEIRALGSGGEWRRIDAPAGGLVVNLGDMLARWTNDRYVSTPHRVVATSRVDRYSIPFFVNPDPWAEVACIPSCVTPEHPCRYEPITAGAFLEGRIDGSIRLDDAPR